MDRITARRSLAATSLAVLAVGAISGCGDDDVTAADSAGAARPVVTFTATDTGLTVPEQVPAGLVDIALDTEPGTLGHHLFIARLDDGVTLEQALADDESFFTMMTIKGGNGTVASGVDLTMTLDLEPGNYFALDNPQLEDSFVAPFTASGSATAGEEPVAEGLVTMGPGMVISAPKHFDGTGTWEFVNNDRSEVHEAALVRLADGKTVEDLIAFAHNGFEGELPWEGDFGSMGALGPGQRAWITIEPGEPGDYALVCFVPGRDFIPHLSKGMAVPVTITGTV